MTARRRNKPRYGRGAWRVVRTVIALALAVAGISYAWRSGEDTVGIDFYQFWAGSQVARQLGDATYDPEMRKTTNDEYLHRAYTSEGSDRMLGAARSRSSFEFFSTPFLYACFGVFGEGKYEQGLFIFRILWLACFVAAVLALGHLSGLSLAQSLLLIAFLTTVFQPLKSDIRVANVNGLQLLVVAVATLLHSRTRFATGALLAMAAMFKPNVTFAVPLLALAGDWSSPAASAGLGQSTPVALWRRFDLPFIAGVATGGIVAVIASSWYFRSSTVWLAWLEAAHELTQTVWSRSDGNLALAQQFGLTASAVIAAVAMTIAATAVMRAPIEGNRLTLIVIGMGLLMYLLASTLVWLHYLILTLPLIVPLLSGAEPMVRRLLALFILSLLAVDPWMVILGIRTTTGESRVIWLGLILLFALGIWRLAEAQRRTRSAPA